MIDTHNCDPTILLVDDETQELDAYRFLLESMGLKNIETLQDSRLVMGRLMGLNNPIVFLDLNMPHKSGTEVLLEIKEHSPHIPVVICTANSEIETAVECLKLGAHDYLVKPISMNSFGSALRSAIEILTLRSEVLSLKGIGLGGQLKKPEVFKNIITKSAHMQNIFLYIESIATTEQPCLILGETGSGKELAAKAIHDASGLEGEFIAVDVSGLDDTLLSDTLFGHIKGAYTGAEGVRAGLIERAKGGTIFLDEIGDLNEVSQVKLLRLLQEKVYYPLGSDKPKKCEARIITAANKNLTSADIKDFRRDLYYRISTHLIKLPALRERKEDIPTLVEHIVKEASENMHRAEPTVSKQAMDMLCSYSFPGNIRELKTYITDAVARAFDGVITQELIADRIDGLSPIPATTSDEHTDLEKIFGKFPTLDELGEYAVDMALKASENNQSQAAKLLGISKQALHKRLKKRESEI